MKNGCKFSLLLFLLIMQNSFCGKEIELPSFTEVYSRFDNALRSSNPHNEVKKTIEYYQKEGIVDPINYCTPHGFSILNIKKTPHYQVPFRSKQKNTIKEHVAILILFGAKNYNFNNFLSISSEKEALQFCRNIKSNLVNFYNWYRNNNHQSPLLFFLIKKQWFKVYKIFFKNHKTAIHDLDQKGNTLLFTASKMLAPLTIIQELVTEIDVNQKNINGFTAIFDAHNKEIFDYLRKSGAHLYIQGKDQQNIMHYAAQWGNYKLLKILIKENFDLQFDLFKRDGFGQTPKDLIQNFDQTQKNLHREKVRKLLKKYYPYDGGVIYFES